MNRLLKLVLLCGLTPAIVSGLVARAWAQTPEQQPLLQVEDVLQTDDETLSNGSFYDVHEFTGQAGQAVTLLLESDAFDPYLILEDDQGDRIAANDNIRGENTNAALVITLPATGRYRVIANAFQAEGQGPYLLTVHSTPASGPNPLLSDAEVTLLETEQIFQSGDEHYDRSDFRTALSLWEDSLARFRTEALRAALPQDSRLGEGNALGNLGLAYAALGDYERAIDFLQQSLDITQEIGDRLGEGNALGNLGTAYDALGDYERAIDFLQQSLAIAREIGDRLGEGTSLGNLGLAYAALGDYERAIDFHQQSLDIAREIGYRLGQATSLNNLGEAYRNLGDYERAIDFLQQSLDITHEIGDRRGEGQSLGGLGIASYFLGDYERAIDFHQQSLDIDREIGNRRGEGQSLGGLGIAYYSLGDYERAIDFHQQSLAITRELGDRLGEGQSLHNLGVAFWYSDNMTEAAQYFEASALAKEDLHTTLADANRLSLLDSQQSTYQAWQMTLMAQGQPKTALAVAERSRAQALAASMARALTSADDDAWTPPTPPNLEQIQAIAIQQQATLVEYAVLPNGRILIWVIQPDGTIYDTESDIEALDDTAALFAGLGQNARGGARFKNSWF